MFCRFLWNMNEIISWLDNSSLTYRILYKINIVRKMMMIYEEISCMITKNIPTLKAVYSIVYKLTVYFVYSILQYINSRFTL